MIQQECGACGKELAIPDKYAGKEGRCKQCGARILVMQAPIPPSPPQQIVQQQYSAPPPPLPPPPPPPPPPASLLPPDSNWYYLEAGNSVGPFSPVEIESLIRSGKITQNTIVWSGQGDWQPAQDTYLSALFATTLEGLSTLPVQNVDNRFVWGVVAVPIVGVIVELIVGMELVWLYIVLNIVCCSLDLRKLKADGHKTPTTWMAFLVPVYLWKRATLLNHKKHYFWIWIVAFFLSIFIGFIGHQAVLEKSAVPLVSQILEENFGSVAAQCKSVTIDEEVSDGFYKATAILDNGSEIHITIEEKAENQIYVRVPL